MKQQIFTYAKKKYGTSPEYPWRQWPEYAVLRHADNRKWYAILMNVTKSQLGLTGGEERMDIMDVKCNPDDGAFLRQQPGFLPGYHMNHQSWLTILLDGTVPESQVLDLLDASFRMTEMKKKK
ncbi:MAG TPA: MmcQ/YjbR family DNA-binding protein [Lachnospiraceae bacterium]|nr:MmcQ/YjbR family DNA-binding protein [Lachnospiraceae bacterium]